LRILKDACRRPFFENNHRFRKQQTPLAILTVMLNDTLEAGRVLTDAALERLLPPATQHPVSIHRAMRHSRGRPTCHKVFGEAIAILAGDALQTQAYETLARLHCPAETRVRIIEEIARGTGTVDGMIGGQVVDLEAEHTKPDLKMLEYIHRSKTAALITASVVSGGLYAGANDDGVEKLKTFGKSIGLAFQIVDDVLDVTQTSEQLGKTAGKDTAAEKATYPALFGIEESLKKADTLVDKALGSLDSFGLRADTLKALARFLVERKK
jgi:geranylgeranyl diphosphate synthase type II